MLEYIEAARKNTENIPNTIHHQPKGLKGTAAKKL